MMQVLTPPMSASEALRQVIDAHKLTPISRTVVPVRFDGALTFSNVAYFEDIILEAIADFPQAKAILVIGSSINEIDASGEERVREVGKQLRKAGVERYFSGLTHQVMAIMERTGLRDECGRGHFFPHKEHALKELLERYDPAGNDDRDKSSGDKPGVPAAA